MLHTVSLLTGLVRTYQSVTLSRSLLTVDLSKFIACNSIVYAFAHSKHKFPVVIVVKIKILTVFTITLTRRSLVMYNIVLFKNRLILLHRIAGNRT